jgi:hypothetical protein
MAGARVIQIRGEHRWAGALAIVSDVRPWGVIAFVPMPTNDGEPTGQAFTRVAHGEFREVGIGMWPPDAMP